MNADEIAEWTARRVIVLEDRLAAAERALRRIATWDGNAASDWTAMFQGIAREALEKAYFSDPDVVPDSPAVQGYHDPSLWEDGPADLNSAKQGEKK